MEEIKADLKALKIDLQDVKHTLRDNTFRMGEYNAELRVHIQATRDLQARVQPIEEHVMFIRKLMQTTTWVFGIAAACATIAKLFL